MPSTIKMTSRVGDPVSLVRGESAIKDGDYARYHASLRRSIPQGVVSTLTLESFIPKIS